MRPDGTRSSNFTDACKKSVAFPALIFTTTNNYQQPYTQISCTDVCQLVKNIAGPYEGKSSLPCSQKPDNSPALSQIHLVLVLPSNYFKIHFHIASVCQQFLSHPVHICLLPVRTTNSPLFEYPLTI